MMLPRKIQFARAIGQIPAVDEVEGDGFDELFFPGHSVHMA